MPLRLEAMAGVSAVPADQWNALAGTDIPFLDHAFLSALEQTGCVGDRTGWTPCPLLLHDDAGLLGAVPLYAKSHSWGEFVFDQGWAQAYARHGLDYFPKLVAAVPFSPVSGPRLLVRRGADHGAVAARLRDALPDFANQLGCSSVHVLFPDAADQALLGGAGWLLREDCQYRWQDRGYGDFESLLASYSSEKRKKARRERRRIEEAGITFRTLHGGDLDEELLDIVYTLHQVNFHRHGHEPYLSRAFFGAAAAALGERMMVKLALHEGRQAVAAAVFFRSGTTLYGRYWGATEQFHSLHFETCYYQGIEYCLQHGLQHFEPGTGGEHKLSRGFEPVISRSAHYIADPRFRAAISEFLQREASAVRGYVEDAAAHTPFRRGEPPA